MVIRKAEEKAIGIQGQNTTNFQETFAIPDSDDLEPDPEDTADVVHKKI